MRRNVKINGKHLNNLRNAYYIVLISEFTDELGIAKRKSKSRSKYECEENKGCVS